MLSPVEYDEITRRLGKNGSIKSSKKKNKSPKGPSDTDNADNLSGDSLSEKSMEDDDDDSSSIESDDNDESVDETIINGGSSESEDKEGSIGHDDSTQSSSMFSTKSNKHSKKSSQKFSVKRSSKKDISGPTSADDTSADDAPTPTPLASVAVPTEKVELFYTLGEGRKLASTEDFNELAEVTRVYLEDCMQDIYGNTLDEFLTFMVFQEAQVNKPVQCDFRSTGRFQTSVPNTDDLNAEIDLAFVDPRINEYLKRVNDLPESNVFSSTILISQDESASTSSSSRNFFGLAAAGAAALLLGAISLLITRRNKNGFKAVGSIDKQETETYLDEISEGDHNDEQTRPKINPVYR